jgi:hypothetical protein
MQIQQLMLPASCVYLAAIAATIYFTQATTRRVLGAFVGGLAVAVVGFAVEVVCQALGFWRYPSVDTGYGPLFMYLLLVLAWAVLSLIGWRVMRRFGWRGEVVFLAVVAVQGTFRDYIEAEQALGVIVIAPGSGTLLLDAFLWGGLTALAQGVMRLVAGPAAADPLSRRPRKADCRTAAPEPDHI